MEQLLALGAPFGLFMLTVIMPGPDVLIVTRTSLQNHLRAGLLTSLGIGAGLLFHHTYALIGTAYIFQKAPYLFNLIRFAGALYFIFLAVTILRSLKQSQISDPPEEKIKTARNAFLTGLFVNLLNVKAVVWILSFYASILPADLSLNLKILFALATTIGAVCFFMFLALTVTRPVILQSLRKCERVLNIIFALLLLFFAGEFIYSAF